MSHQYSIDFPTGADLRDEGMNKAIIHADYVTEKWSDMAYAFLMKYIQSHPFFMAEDVREASKEIVPEPPHKRAWGGIVRRAATEGFIIGCGIQKVKNPTSHCANAAVWAVNIQAINEKVA